MTKYLSIGAAVVIAGLCLLTWIQEKRIERLTVRVTQCQAAVAVCRQQARTYQAWEEINAATSRQIKTVVGADVTGVVSALNELFGRAKTVPPAPGAPGRSGQTKPPVRRP